MEGSGCSRLTVVARCEPMEQTGPGSASQARGEVPPGQPIANRAGSGWDRAVSNGLACRLAGWRFLTTGCNRQAAGWWGGVASLHGPRSPAGNEGRGGSSEPSVRTAYTSCLGSMATPRGWCATSLQVARRQREGWRDPQPSGRPEATRGLEAAATVRGRVHQLRRGGTAFEAWY